MLIAPVTTDPNVLKVSAMYSLRCDDSLRMQNWTSQGRCGSQKQLATLTTTVETMEQTLVDDMPVV